MKAVAALLLALLVGCGGGSAHVQPAPPQPSQRETLQAMQDRTVSINVECPQGSGYGSGVRYATFDPGIQLVVTANHVVSEQGCLFNIDGQYALVLATDPANDLAALVVPSLKTYETLPAPTYLGMDIWAVGYPSQWWTDGKGLQITRGVVVAQYEDRWRVSSSFYFGSSGGPAFDSEGRLVGITVSARMVDRVPVADHFFIVPVDKVEALVAPLR